MNLFTKTILVVIAIFLVILICGFTGILFVVWPTSFADKELAIDQRVIKELVELKEKKKFYPEKAHFYPGAPNEIVRIDAEHKLNGIIDDLIRNISKNPKKSYVLKSFKTALPKFDKFDSEERDQTLNYLEQIMTIMNIEDSGELFNVWRYGFPYGILTKKT